MTYTVQPPQDVSNITNDTSIQLMQPVSMLSSDGVTMVSVLEEAGPPLSINQIQGQIDYSNSQISLQQSNVVDLQDRLAVVQQYITGGQP